MTPGLTPEQLAKQKDHLLKWEYWSHKRLGDETQDFSFTVFKESLQFIVQEKLQWRQTNHELESQGGSLACRYKFENGYLINGTYRHGLDVITSNGIERRGKKWKD